MVDIETLGNKTDSTIFQIAAAAFDIKTGKITHSFSHIANIEENSNLKVTGATLKWWLNTDKELLSELLNKGEGSSDDLLRRLADWMIELTLHYDMYLWGNGILFDNKMIQQQLEAIGINYPIFFRNDRDVRTILELAAVKEGVSTRDLRNKYYDTELSAHDAGNDVKNQIKLVSACYNLLTN